MQHRYTGDVGDFGKYGLLRALASPPGEAHLQLGLVWYLVPEEESNGDGGHIGYLTPKAWDRYEACDPALFGAMQRLVTNGERHLDSIENAGIFDDNTAYFPDPLSFASLAAREERAALRNEWLERALEVTRGCAIVFLDPDNGLVGLTDLDDGTERLLRLHGPKHTNPAEINRFLHRGQSVVLYHHLDRSATHQQQSTRVLELLRAQTGVDAFGFWFRRGTSRLFAVIPAVKHRDLLNERAARFAASPWVAHGHFTPVGL